MFFRNPEQNCSYWSRNDLETFKITRVRGGNHGRKWHFGRARPPSREMLPWKRWMVPAAAAVVADGWFAFVNYMMNNKHLCCHDGDLRCVLEDPSRRWLDDAVAPIVVDFVASTSSCNEIVMQSYLFPNLISFLLWWIFVYLLFWYQVFTWVSESDKASATSLRSATLRYFWQRNFLSR